MTAGRSANSTSKDWGTPIEYVEAVRQVFNGDIALDPCSNRHSIVNAETEYRLPRQDGLRKPWDFPTIYVNPPYGRDVVRHTSIADWLLRCASAHAVYDSEVLALVPVLTDSGPWKEYIWGRAAAICFFHKRPHFLLNGRPSGRAIIPCAMVYWGDNFAGLFDAFCQFGEVIPIRHGH